MMHNTKKGFTLLEVLLTLVLLATGVIAIAGLFGAGLSGSLDAEYTSIAMNLSQGRLEEIRNKDYDSIADEEYAEVTGFPLFQRKVDVTEPFDELKQVTVTTSFQYKNSTVEIPLVTYVSKN